jgi:hypothetical protein
MLEGKCHTCLIFSSINPKPFNRVVWYLNLRGIPYTQCACSPKNSIDLD